MYKTKTGLYRKQVTINGQRKVFSGKTQRDVYLKIAEYQEQQKNGVPFRDACEEWYNDCEARLSINSLKLYRYCIELLTPTFGDKYMAEITTRDIQSYFRTFAQARPKHTVQSVMTVIKAIYKHANLIYDINYNPTTYVTLPKAQRGKERHFPSDEDISIITEHANDEYGLFPFMALYTGLRRGELCALRWRDIDFANKVIHVRNNIVWTPKPVMQRPKTETSVRDVPMTEAVASVLQPQALDDYIFGGCAPYEKKIVTHTIPDTLRALGVQSTIHELRHGFASMLFRQGLDIQSISKILGHASINITMSVYLHEMDKRYMDVARNMLDEIHTKHTPMSENL